MSTFIVQVIRIFVSIVLNYKSLILGVLVDSTTSTQKMAGAALVDGAVPIVLCLSNLGTKQTAILRGDEGDQS